MTLPETGNPDANPTTAPEASPAPAPIPHASDAQKEAAKLAAFERAKTATPAGKPTTGANTEPSGTEEPPTFFTQPAKKSEEPPAFDPSKLPAELQPVYKAMQADATRKWEEAARMRREMEEREAKFTTERQAMLDGQKSLLEALARGRTQESGTESPTVVQQIQQLRDEGRHAEADQLLLAYVDQAAEKKAEPYVKQAHENLVRSSFHDTLAEIRASNKMAAHYWDQTAAVFDGNDPQIVALRKAVIGSGNPDVIKTFMPMVVDWIAAKHHIYALETSKQTAIEAGIKKGLEDRRAAAGRTPARLVESGAESKQTAPGKMSLSQAFMLAKESS